MPIYWWSAPQVAKRYHSHTDDSWIFTDLSVVLSCLSCAYLYWQVLSDCWVDLYMFAGHNCLCDIADEQPLLYYCWSQLAVWHRRRTPSGLTYICSLVTTVCVTSPTNNLCYIIVGHNWLCDIVGEHHLGWFICWCATAGFFFIISHYRLCDTAGTHSLDL